MTCTGRAPAYHSFPMVNTGARQYGNLNGDGITTAFEIAPYSELDRCLVKSRSGYIPVAVGAPAIGPFEGPFLIEGSGGAAPCSQFSANAGLVTLPPVLGLIQHFEQPAGFAGRRAATSRRRGEISTSSSLAGIFEVPMYGRTRCSLSFVLASGGPTVATIQVEGAHFFQNSKGPVTELDYGYMDSVIRSRLIINPSADVTLGPSIYELLLDVATLGTAISIEAESFHTLLIKAESDAVATWYCLAECLD